MNIVKDNMIKKFEVEDLGYDFMGFKIKHKKELDFHHLIIPKRDCAAILGNDGVVEWNCALLCHDSSHPYLHVIERIDRKLFEQITDELIEINCKGFVDIENLKNIEEMLEFFEEEHKDTKTSKGKMLIKSRYKDRILYKK